MSDYDDRSPLGNTFKRPTFEIIVPSNAKPGTPRVIIGGRTVPPELVAAGVIAVTYRTYGTGNLYYWEGYISIAGSEYVARGVSDGVTVLRIEREDIKVDGTGAHFWEQGFHNFEGSLKGVNFNDPPVRFSSNIRITEGANKIMGTAVLVAGTKVVNDTAVAADTRIFLTTQVPGGTVGTPYVSAIVAGTSFTITSTSAADTSTVAYLLIRP